VTFQSASLKWWVERTGNQSGNVQWQRQMGIPYLNSPTEAFSDEAAFTGYVYYARPSPTATPQGHPSHWEIIRSYIRDDSNPFPGAPDGAGNY
jgi:hypothetical protein